MKLIRTLFIGIIGALVWGCVSTAHLSEIEGLLGEPNPARRLKYITQLQYALKDYIKHNRPDPSHRDYLNKQMVGVTWFVFNDSEWVCIFTNSHHADHTWPEKKRVRDISLAIDSRGNYFYTLASTCAQAPIVHTQTPITSLDEFWRNNCFSMWAPLPPP